MGWKSPFCFENPAENGGLVQGASIIYELAVSLKNST